MSIEYIEIKNEEIFIIKKLWKKLNKFHSNLSPFFSEEYLNKKFIDWKKELLEKTEKGILKILIAKDINTKNIVGYCICSINNNIGEIDSIFVEESYRKHNIGHGFLIKSDDFFKINLVKKQILNVYVGNENVIKFYNKHNYYQKYILLEKKRSK